MEVCMNRKYKCPKCGGKLFTATAHVAQEWALDEYGNFTETISNCTDVVHKPDDEDLWFCLNCDHEAAGSEFRVGGE
jgi:ribosomal protein L37AE/L43A